MHGVRYEWINIPMIYIYICIQVICLLSFEVEEGTWLINKSENAAADNETDVEAIVYGLVSLREDLTCCIKHACSYNSCVSTS